MADRRSSMRIAAGAAEPGDLDGLVGYNLKRAYEIVREDFRRALGEDGPAPRMFSALSLIVQFPNVTQSELARMLGIERSGLVAIVDDLEARGYLRRNPVPGDRRARALSPTAAGTEAYERMRGAVRAHEDALLSDLSPEERSVLIDLLRRIRDLGD